MSKKQILNISYNLEINPGSLLIFGLGNDSGYWKNIQKDNLITFVEDDPKWFYKLPNNSNIVKVNYHCKNTKWHKEKKLPNKLRNHNYDYVIVDGPIGYNEQCPGRQFSIYWGSLLVNKIIWVHDYNRLWEKTLCDKYIKAKPNLVINGKYGSLAKFII